MYIAVLINELLIAKILLCVPAHWYVYITVYLDTLAKYSV